MNAAFELNHIHHADAVDLIESLPDASVTLCITDPPYDQEHSFCFDILARVARVLVPGGSLVTLLGQMQLPYAFDALMPHLTYYWQGWLYSNGTWAPLHGKRIFAGGKPYLWFVNGSQRLNPRTFVLDTITSTRRSKEHHPWQQGIEFPLEFIEKLTQPGDLVLDPFAGGGTFPAAAKMLGRRWIGSDVDPVAVEIANARINEVDLLNTPTQPALFELDRKEQSTIQRLQKKRLRHQIKALKK